MNRSFIPAEYDLPDEVNGPHKRLCWAALAATPIVIGAALIIGASLALVASNETQSPVTVVVSR
jgi:hypothetical protein